MTEAEVPARHGAALWVYALAECGAGARLPGVAGVAGGDVRLVGCGTLTAVVSDVSLAEFGAQPLRQNMEDLAWLETVARAHHGAIDAAARLFPVLPMRFATVYTSQESMVAALTAHAARLRRALESLRSSTEWGVKAYVRQAAQADPGAREATTSCDAASAGAGVAYLRRRRDALSARRDTARGAAESARAIHEELAGHARDSRLHPAQSPQLSGRSEAMVLNAAYLVDDDRTAGFTQAVEALSGQDPRLSLELTGPWPPYSFTVQELEQEEGA